MNESLIQTARDLFVAEFGSDTTPDGIWWAPGRVNIIGEHTDYNGGYVLPIALPLGTVAVVRRRDDSLIRACSEGQRIEVDLADIRSTKLGWAAYVAGVGWAAQQEGLDVPGIDIAFAADIPRGAGLSSSASLSCATAKAWNDLAGWGLDGAAIARLGRIAENEIAGAPTGTMDQMASVLCTEGHALALNTLTNETEQIPFNLDDAGMCLLVVNSHAPHELVDGAYGERRCSCEQAADALGVPRGELCTHFDGSDTDALNAKLIVLPDVQLRRARHVITDSARVQQVSATLRGGITQHNAAQVGALLNASHASMRDDFEITVPEVDVLAQALTGAGAYGARMTGGGFGGCVIALIDRDLVDGAIAHAKTQAQQHGFAEPEPFIALASAGASRIG